MENWYTLPRAEQDQRGYTDCPHSIEYIPRRVSVAQAFDEFIAVRPGLRHHLDELKGNFDKAMRHRIEQWVEERIAGTTA